MRAANQADPKDSIVARDLANVLFALAPWDSWREPHGTSRSRIPGHSRHRQIGERPRSPYQLCPWLRPAALGSWRIRIDSAAQPETHVPQPLPQEFAFTRLLREYAWRGLNKPIGVSQYELTRALPAHLQPSQPTVEEIEAELPGELARTARKLKRRQRAT